MLRNLDGTPLAARKRPPPALTSPIGAAPQPGALGQIRAQQFGGIPHETIDNLANNEVAAENPNDPNYLENMRNINDGRELAKLQWQDTHPYGTPENHPGVMGKIEHVLGTVGNIAGDMLVPGAMAQIPGTALNRGIREHELEGQIDKSRQLDTENLSAEARELAAETAHEKQADEPPPSTPESRAAEAEKYGLHPGTPAFDDYVLTGKWAPPEKPLSEKATFFVGPDGKPVQGYSQGGKNYLADGTPLPAGYGPYKGPPAPGKPLAGLFNGKPASAIYGPGLGYLHASGPDIGKPFPGFELSPTYAEEGPAARTVSITPRGGVPEMREFDVGTNRFDIPVGTPGTGRYAGQMQEAGASVRMIDATLHMLRNAPIGTVEAWGKGLLLGTPIADPELARLRGMLVSIASMQPVLHGLRSASATQAFRKIIGGLAKNPQAMIATLEGLKATARAVNPNLPAEPKGTSKGNGGADYTYDPKTGKLVKQ